MCTFNIALDDKVVNTARKAFQNEENLTAWMEEQITVLLSNYVSLNTSTVKKRDNTKEMLAKYAGALDDGRSTDSIIANIYNSRNSKPITEFSL